MVRTQHPQMENGQPSAMETIFTEIYVRNLWEDGESRSGPGSNLAKTSAIRTQLPLLLDLLGVRSLVDAPCGDFHWMQHTPLQVKRYIGVDVVPALIARNRAHYSGNGREFHTADITRDRLPKCDAILCRDCFIHLPFADIALALSLFHQSGARYLLVTNHPALPAHDDIAAGMWRSVNLHLAPFSFPEPRHRLLENPVTGKTLDVWHCASLPTPPRKRPVRMRFRPR
jgi:hypothetical protein